MGVNDEAFIQDKRVAFKTIASELAPTEKRLPGHANLMVPPWISSRANRKSQAS
ncbi:hypothetical protein J2W17_002101 [Pseudomonas lini]|nr:hypothetical protein [Pseudomonas lini]